MITSALAAFPGPEPLPPDLADAAEGVSGWRSFEILYYSEIGSTNDVALALGRASVPEGAVVVAKRQTAGRGRAGRVWSSPPGGLYVSVLLRPPPELSRRPGLITLGTGVALATAVQRVTGLSVELKWPNDLVICERREGAIVRWRKLGGILAEASSDGGTMPFLVVGFGLNLQASGDEAGSVAASGSDATIDGGHDAAIPVERTSIERECGRVPGRGEVLSGCLRSLAETYARLCQGETAAVLGAWRRLAPSSLGAAVSVGHGAGTRYGIAGGIGADGALLILVGSGVEAITAGDVRWHLGEGRHAARD